jgi:hypothetical protein
MFIYLLSIIPIALNNVHSGGLVLQFSNICSARLYRILKPWCISGLKKQKQMKKLKSMQTAAMLFARMPLFAAPVNLLTF